MPSVFFFFFDSLERRSNSHFREVDLLPPHKLLCTPILISTLLSAMAAAAPPRSSGSPKLDAVVQKTSAKTPEKLSGVALYSRFALAGAVCCSVTHGALTPVDV